MARKDEWHLKVGAEEFYLGDIAFLGLTLLMVTITIIKVWVSLLP